MPATATAPFWAYSFADIDKLAHRAVSHVGGTAQRVAFDDARSEILTALWMAESRPPEALLVSNGKNAVRNLYRTDQRHHGVPLSKAGRHLEPRRHTAPGFVRYWHCLTPSMTEFEDDLIDHLDHEDTKRHFREVMADIWPLLPTNQQEALLARAVFDTNVEAAASLGISKSAFSNHLNDGRRRIKAALAGEVLHPLRPRCQITDLAARREAVVRLREKGWTHAQIADALHLHVQTIGSDLRAAGGPELSGRRRRTA